MSLSIVTCLNCKKEIDSDDTYWYECGLDFCSKKCEEEFFDKASREVCEHLNSQVEKQ